MSGRPESDRIGRLVRDRPGAVARAALASWAVGLAVLAADLASDDRGPLWPWLAFPVFVPTAMAAVALFLSDPERAGLDALRGGLIAAFPSALLVGRAATRAFEAPSSGRIALVCMAGAAVGSVVGALAGPVAGWALRSAARAARGLIRGPSRRR